MNKVIVFFGVCSILLVMQVLHARDNAVSWPHYRAHGKDTLRQGPDTGRQVPDLKDIRDTGAILPEDSTLKMLDSAIRARDSMGKTTVPATMATDSSLHMADTTGRVKDSTTKVPDTATGPIDTSARISVPSADSTRPAVQTQEKTSDKPVDNTTARNGDNPAGNPAGSATDIPTVKSTDNPSDSTKSITTDKPADNATDKPAGSAVDQATDKPADKTVPSGDSTQQQGPAKRELDKRWFISPLLKFQFQDFGMLEKNRKGYLSDANTLPFQNRGNGSFAASAYKNLTSRLSFSADIGISFGHLTNDNVLISQTPRKTYNLLAASVYYHLLAPSYRLQPYVSIGINDLINDQSYLTAPIGFGAKFNSKKIMVLAQVSYGVAVNKNISNSTMYSLGIYIPIKNKKKSKSDSLDNSPYNRPGNDKDKDKDKKKTDSTAKNGGVVNNIYITINMDSVLKARGYGNDDDGDGTSGGRRKRKGSGSNQGDDGDAEAREAFKAFDLDDFASNDFKIDHIDGHPVIRFVVYFEFNEYGLTTKAFSSIDKVINHLRNTPNMYIEIKGYTDDVGTDQYNNFLSRRRANMVKDYINSRGISADLMKAKAYGKDNPVADNSDPNKAWLNRRAEIIVRLK